MERLQEILSWLMTFITEKKKRKVILEIDFEDGNIRNCKINEGKQFRFKE